jgi:hypothetical protein
MIIFKQSCVELPESLFKSKEQRLNTLSYFVLMLVWTMNLMAGDPVATLDHEETWR